MEDIEYTYEDYVDILEYLKSHGYQFKAFTEKQSGREVFLRHDVDWSPAKALRLAEVESDLGVKSTYFFQVTSVFYNVLNQKNRDIIRDIEELGHHVGLHFDANQYWADEPNKSELGKKVQNEFEVLDIVAGSPTRVVAFHNPREWLIGADYDGFVSTYEDGFFENMDYVSDSLHRWKQESIFEEIPGRQIQVLTHPTLWGERTESATAWIKEAQEDIINDMNHYMKQHSRLDW